MWLGVYYFRNFWSVPGEHYRFWHVPCARNCVYLHLFIDIIHGCCSKTAMQLATHFIRYHPRKRQPVIFTKISNKSRRNSLQVLYYVCEYQFKWVCTFDVISKTPVFSIEIPGPAHHIILILPTLTWTCPPVYSHLCYFEVVYRKRK